MNCQFTMFLGTYLLGVDDADERLRIEGHLPGCAACREELARLAPLPGLLSRVPTDQVPEGVTAVADGVTAAAELLTAAAVVELPPRVQAVAPAAPTGAAEPPLAPRRRARPPRAWSRRAMAGAAAAAILGIAAGFGGAAGLGIAGGPGAAGRPGATTGPGSAHRSAGQAASTPTVTFAGADAATRVEATAALTATSWGTSITLRLRGVPSGVQCRLVVHARNGGAEIAGMWNAWSPGTVAVPASAAWRPSDIASLQVVTARRSLVTMTAPSRASSP